MVFPKFFVLLLSLAYALATDAKFETGVPKDSDLHFLIDPGFQVNKAELNGTAFEVCTDKKTSNCYTDDPATLVNFYIKTTNDVKKLKFEGASGVSKTFTATSAATSAENINNDGTKAAEEKFKLPFVPTKIVPLGADENSVGQDKEVADSKNKNCRKTGPDNCLSIMEEFSHINMTATIETTALLLKLTGADPATQTIEATFVPISSAVWMPRSTAVILATLAIMAYFY
ncbi:unnamed protein product [Dibothriocephalus latus]|uniref:DUF5727 domain-containing protein n=1 Tax=Dibothriocephalus latus TaxID=60516 RepID=A0A3P6QK29_DIBLA|nr:unnamed protein product [Dibothriocephalus latus]